MKKAKRVTALLLTVLMCLSLCGCQNLEDMRATQAFWQEDGSIKWNGYKYLPLEGVPENIDFVYTSSIQVTKADVPVLLSGMFGDTFSVDKSGVLLHSWVYGADEICFCREDQYDYMVEYLQQGIEMNTYFYTYWTDDDDDDDQKFYYLTKEQQSVIDDLMDTVNFTDMDKDFYASLGVDEYSLTLGMCDEKHWFTNEHVLEIVWKDGKFYLVTQEAHVGEVPTDDYDVMRTIVKAYYKAEIEPYI